EKAGLKAGDVVTAVGERNIATPHDLISFARMQHRSGKSVTVALVRDHKDLTLSIAPYENQE
ncbi:MAG: PDZ domain-containing protein, partial [Acidobacteriaceae bacterium]|nr:PDZ domain-containing protein [Acidobacteriaceae bacterium]